MSKPAICLDLGTGIGISAAYQLAALDINQKGTLITLEGAGSLALIAKNNLNKLGLKKYDIIKGRFQGNLERIITKNHPVDFVFIDGHHDETATQQYFQQILPKLSNKAIVVFDDISWSAGMKNAWNNIKCNNQIKVSFDLNKFGVCIIDKNKKDSITTIQFILYL